MTDATSRERMQRAIRAIRREGRKAAAIHAAAYGVAVLLAVNLALAVLAGALPDALAAGIPLPAALPDAGLPDAVDATALVAAAAGLLTAVGAYAWTLWRPTVERFEAVNPPVAEALRTARDAVRADREGPMADRLYESVMERLQGTSSVGLVNLRRLAATVALVALLGAANVQVAVLDLDLVGGGPTDAGAGDGRAPGSTDEYSGLQDPDEVLGEPEDVSAGSEEVNATIGTQGGGNGSGSTASYATGGFASGASVESQQAGFAEQERLEDAELIREYNLRIRDDEEESG